MRKIFSYNLDFWTVLLVTVILVGIVLIIFSLFNATGVLGFETISPNEQTLNAYATFESNCHYRGYDRNECLLIWSGR